VFGYKLQSLVIGGSIGALAGVFFGIQSQSVNPDSFLPLLTFLAYVVVILGGPGRVAGPVVGAVLFWFLISITEGVLRQAVGAGYIPEWLLAANEVAAVRWILVGGALMLLMAFRPQGLFGSREETYVDAR
jgi:branched-chain amino acid transport system permease protein